MSKSQTFRRDILATLSSRVEQDADRIQVVQGPRQVGKTTIVRQLLAEIDAPGHYASADDPVLRNAAWLQAQWEEGRRLARARNGAAVLVIDEVQKVGGWAEAVKRLWDEDRGRELPLRVVLLGSAALLVQGTEREPRGALRADPRSALVIRRDARRVRLQP